MDSHQQRPETKEGNAFSVESIPSPHGLMASGNTAENSCTKWRQLENNPMKMGNIVEKVLSFVNSKIVKELREVSKLWSSEGAKRLLKTCNLSIPYDHKDFVHQKAIGKVITEPEEFDSFLANLSTYIRNIPNVTIQREGDFELWKSLDVLGPQVNCLKLAYVDDQLKLLHKLLILLPNLKYLNWDESGYWNMFRAIKILNSVMPETAEDRPPLILSGLSISLENEEQLEELATFSGFSNIKIEILVIVIRLDDFSGVPTFMARITNIVAKLLSNSRDTLKHLHLSGCDEYLSLLKFPCMISLTHMDLIFENPDSDSRFSQPFTFSKNIPKLRKLEIKCRRGDGYHLGRFLKLLDNTGRTTSVKQFRLDYNSSTFTYDFVGLLLHVFPNVEEFQAPSTSLCRESLKSLWIRGEQLKKLAISINLDSYGNALRLDSIITGFPIDTIKDMKSPPTLDRLEELRVKPSILKLKELESLDIYLEDNSYGILNVLKVTGEHAFKLMPSNMPINIYFLRKHDTNVTQQVSKLPNVSIKQTRNILDFLMWKIVPDHCSDDGFDFDHTT